MAFKKVLTKQHKTVQDNITHLAGKSLKGIADTLLNMSEEDQNFSDGLNPVLQSLTLQQGQLAMEFSGGSSSDYQQSRALQSAVAASTKKMSQNFDQETLDQLNRTLTEGLQNSESISELSARVSEVYESAQGYRADRIARTESQYASNQATLDAYQQNPIVVSMTWFANPDACDYCDELDGTTVGTEELFVAQGDSVDVGEDSYQADYGDVDTPPLHPNCSCTIVPETDDGSDSGGIGDNADGSDSIDAVDGTTDPSVEDNAGTEDTSTTDQSSDDGTIDENGFPAIPDRAQAEADNPPPEDESNTVDAYHGTGSNVSNGNYALGDGYYVSRTEDGAAAFGDVSSITLKLKNSDILMLPDQAAYQTLVNEAIRTYPHLPFNQALPKLVQDKGYRAAEISPDVDPLGGIAVYDKKAIPK